MKTTLVFALLASVLAMQVLAWPEKKIDSKTKKIATDGEDNKLDQLLDLLKKNKNAKAKKTCDSDAVDQCTSEVVDDYIVEDPLLAPVDDAMMTELCGDLSSAANCVDASTACGDSNTATGLWWQTAYNAGDYLCNAGQSGLETFQSCVSDSNIEKYYDDLFECLFEFPDDDDRDDDLDDTCDDMYASAICFAIAAEDNCQSSAFVTAYLGAGYSPLADYIGCSLDKSAKRTSNLKKMTIKKRMSKMFSKIRSGRPGARKRLA